MPNKVRRIPERRGSAGSLPRDSQYRRSASSYILVIHSACQGHAHIQDRSCAFCRIQDGVSKEPPASFTPSFFLILRASFALPGEQAFFIEHGPIERMAALLWLPDFAFLLALFELLLDRFFGCFISDSTSFSTSRL